MKKAKNSGFTLMELLIMIVIIGIVAGFTYLSVSNIGSSAARRAANEMNMLISRCRSACLSMGGESYIELKAAADGGCEALLYEGGKLAETLPLGGARVSCTYNGGSPAAGIKMSFQRGTGAMKTGGAYSEVSSLEFSGGNAEEKIYIVPATGSHGMGEVPEVKNEAG